MTHHSRKLKLSPLQREVIWMLGTEAGAETVPCVLNTLHEQFPDTPWSELVRSVEEAVKGLLDLGLISFRRFVERKHGAPFYVTLEPDEIPQVLSFQTNYARFSETTDWPNSGHLIELEITDAGERALQE